MFLLGLPQTGPCKMGLCVDQQQSLGRVCRQRGQQELRSGSQDLPAVWEAGVAGSEGVMSGQKGWLGEGRGRGGGREGLTASLRWKGRERGLMEVHRRGRSWDQDPDGLWVLS